MKNTKIMAVLVVLLAAMLFVGAVSAAVTPAEMKNVTANETSVTLVAGETSSAVYINVTNETAVGVAQSPALNLVFYSWNSTSAQPLPTAVGNDSTIKLDGGQFTAGQYTLQFYDAAAIAGANVSTNTVAINVIKAVKVTPGDSPSAAPNTFVNQVLYIEDRPTNLMMYEGTVGESQVLNTIPVKGGIINLLESAVKGQYGSYAYNTSSGWKYINIWDPSMTLKVELAGSPGDSVNGKTVTRDTELAFYVEAPVVANADAVDDAAVKLVFTTPSGGSVTTFNGQSFDGISLTEASQLIKSVAPGSNAQAGVWTVQAEYTSPEEFKNYAAKSNTITFTVQSSTLTLTAAKDSVIRSNPFTVTIKGNANTAYAIYIDNADASDNAPTLAPGQVGWQVDFDGTATSIDGTETVVSSGAVFTTNAAGERVIQYNTASDTNDKSYTIPL